jgi:hypothetical protein
LFMVQGRESVPSVSETVKNDTASRALDGMLKKRDYGDGTRTAGASS